jgi:sigma-B regulation protein RsbU (phosphoserine phosphatase)
LDPAEHRCSFGLAGHPPPLIYRHASDTIETMELQGSILGVFEEEQYQQETFHFEDEDVFMAFTDGLLEARSDGEFYGRKRIETEFRSVARGSSAEAITKRLLEDAKSFGEISDDTVVFALKFLSDEAR